MVTAENQNTVIIATAPGLSNGFSGIIPMNAGSTERFQLILPGQTAVPGSYLNNARGLTGFPDVDNDNSDGQDPFIAGTPFNVQIRAVDQYWNKTTAEPVNMSLVSTDGNDTPDPLSVGLTNGATTIQWTFKTSTSTGWQLTVDDGPAAFFEFTSTDIPTNPGVARKLQVLLPGEIAAPGTPTGKSGSPFSWMAGVSSRVIVNVVDDNWNVVPTAGLSVRLYSNTDIWSSTITLPLVNGTTTFNFVQYTATAATTLTLQRVSGQAIDFPTAVSASFVINPNVVTQLQTLVAGEFAMPGKSPYDGTAGRAGYPDFDLISGNGQTSFPAGSQFPVTVRAVDNYYNLVAANAKVLLTTQDPYDTHPASQTLTGGTTVFNIYMQTENTAPGWTITVSTAPDSPSNLLPNTSPAVPVIPGAAARLQLLLPGETAVAGFTTNGAKGKINSPNPAVAGTQYDIRVRLTDAFYNLITNQAMPTVGLTSTDPNDDETGYFGGNPQTLDTFTGEATFGVFFNTSSSWTVTATDDPYTNAYTNDTSTWVYVQPGAPVTFLVVLPGETYAPGKTSPLPLGKTGTPDVQPVGEDINFDVYIVDSFFNQVSTAQNPVTITTDDQYDTNPGAVAISTGWVGATANLRHAKASTIITVTDNDALPPALITANSASMQVVHSTASKIQLVLPGETPQPGNFSLPRGVINGPNPALAGVNIPVEVRITDNFWNVTTATSSLRITSSDPFDQSTGPWVAVGKDPLDVVVSSGKATFGYPLITLSTTGWSLSISDLDDNPGPFPLRFSAFTSSTVAVQAGPPSKLITILPGEAINSGAPTGKTGSVEVSTAGVEIDVEVYTTDQFNNVVTVPPALAGTNSADIQISVNNNTDPYVSIMTSTKPITPATGLTVFQMTLFKAGTHTILAEDITPTHVIPWTQSQSAQLTVDPNSAEHLLVLMPGEDPLPGSGAPGKINSPTPRVAGATFSVTATIVDDYYNPQPNHIDEQIRIDTSDLFDVHPSSALIPSGQSSENFVLRLRTAGANHTITAVDTNIINAGKTYTPSTSPDTGTFTVNASSASRLLVLALGETHVPGSTTGKVNTPTPQVAGVGMTVTVKVTDEQFNPTPTATMPEVLMTTNDPLAEFTSSNPRFLVNGERTFNFIPKTAMSTYSITAATSITSPAGTEGYKSGQTVNLRVWPGVEHHLHLFDLPASSVIAGNNFSASVMVHDEFHNLLSTGPNRFLGSITFDAETTTNGGLTDPGQNPSLPSVYNFISIDAGIKVFDGLPEGDFALKKAGSRWLSAEVFGNSVVNSERPGYSTRPFVGVTPNAAFKYIVLAPQDLDDGITDGKVVVSAGNLSNLGRTQIIGQLSDQFNNYISTPNFGASLGVINVVGSTGTVRWDNGGSFDVITTTQTDANGQVGANPPIYYFVSTKTADTAQVRVSSNAIIGDTLTVESRGGTPSQLVFISPPASAVAGQFVANQFTLERRDDFGNPTTESVSNVNLLLAVGQGTIHTNDGKFFSFTDPLDQATSINSIQFGIGQSQRQFSYYDEMSSTPLGEDGRLGTWEIRAEGPPLSAASHQLTVNAGPTARIGVDNPKRTIEAGKITYQSVVQEYEFELWDAFKNPTIATATIPVLFESTRTPSATLDNFGFVWSSNVVTLPGLAANTTNQIEITTGTYGTKFWYFDTTSSEIYGVLASSRPIIGGQATNRSWRTVDHYVTIRPTWDVDNKVVIISTPASLTAGATTIALSYQLQDRYSNPTPVFSGQEDSPGNGILFNLQSNSGGNYGFSSPSSTTFVSGNGTAVLKLNQHTTTYYLSDTLAGTHQQTIAEASGGRGWTAANQNYTVLAASPTRIIFNNPQRKLIAGSTQTYLVGISSAYIRAQTRDVYNNIAPVFSNQVIDIFSDSPLGQASVTPDNLGSFTSIFGSNALSLTFNGGEFQRDFYYKDQITGFPNITAVHQGGILIPATQQAVITPSSTTHLSMHHPYNIGSPLSVRNEGTISVVMRDQFDNPADGGYSLGEDNGLAYSGQIFISHSGSTNSVTIKGDGVGNSTLTIVNSATASFNVTDIIQETLSLGATDLAVTSIYGHTGISPSDGDVITTGIVGTPTDMAPEPAGPGRSPFKDAIVVANNLSQGDGVTVDQPNPVAMLRVRMEVKPTGVPSFGVWRGLRVHKFGTAANADVVEVALWKDLGFKDGVFNISEDGGGGDGITPGIPLATGTFTNLSGDNISDLVFNISSQTVNTVFQQYFITVRISTQATVGATLGVGIVDSSAFTIPAIESTARISENNFPMLSYQSQIIKTPAPVMLRVENIAAYYDNAQNATVPQGKTAVGYMKLGFWTREFEGILDKIKVTRIGSGNDLDIENIRMYLDGLNGTDGDGFFQPGSDTLINSTVVKFSTSSATLDIQPNILIDGTTKYYFIVMGIADSASIGATAGVRIPARTDVILADGIMVDFLQDPNTQSFPVLSGTPQIQATTDKLVINPIPVAPAAATQGESDVPVVRLQMNSDDHTVILKGIRIDLKNSNQVNSPSDVSDIRVYYDVDGDLLLNPAVDSIVTPVGQPILFPTTLIDLAITDLSTVIPVDSIDGFPPAPGRLVLEDNTGNREVVTYTGVDAGFNQFTGVIRAQESTTAVAHGAGATVQGQAELQILGPFSGQEILKNNAYRPETILAADLGTSTGPLTIELVDTTELPSSGILQVGSEVGIAYTGKTGTSVTGAVRPTPVAHLTGETVLGPGRNKAFFVAYDIAPLATPGRLVGQQTVLGLNMAATWYVTVGAPDQINPIPSFNAEIGDVLEFGDTITVVATETIQGPTLQQNTVNNAVMMLFMETNQSEAFWSGLVVHATGTAAPSDVERIKLWYDADNNGIFAPNNDVVLASGTFGNAGKPSEANLVFPISQLLVTAPRGLAENISRRFFITYDIESLATPETTLGAIVKAPVDFSMTPTPPNFDLVSPVGLPYKSQLRTIIPSPRIVTVQPQLILSNTLGTGQIPTTDGIVSPTASQILVTPGTLSMPTSGYAVLGSEVIFYGNKGAGTLENVQRNLLGTNAQQHANGTKIGSFYTQGDINVGYMKLLVNCNGFNVRWFTLKMNRFLPPGSIKGSDSDVTTIKVWRDNGNGTLDRDPATGQIPLGTEILVGQKALGTGGDTGGSAVIALNDPSIGNPGFALITSAQTTYWITVDVNPTALFDDLLALKIQSDTSLGIGALTLGDGIHSVSSANLPVESPAFLIRPTIDTMKVFVEDLAPPQVSQAQQHIPMARINVKTDANTAVWERLRVDLTSDSGAVSGDISQIRLFKDVGNDGFFGVEETSQTVDGSYINMVSLGTEVFTDLITDLILIPQVVEAETVKPAGQNYFLTYDVNAFAQVGVNIGALIASTNYFTIGFPDLLVFDGQTAPINTSRAAILEAVDKVTLSVDDRAKTLAGLGGTFQAATNVEILRFNLTTDISQAFWQGIRVERTGASADPAFPFGHNADVKFVKVWKDINFNDQLDSSDDLLSPPTIQFNLNDENDRIKTITLNNPVLISPTPQSFFISYDIGEGAEAGASVGLKIGDKSWITVSQPNEVSPTVKILTFGATNQAYPYQTSLVPIGAIKVSMQGQSMAPSQIPQKSTGVPMLMFSMTTDRNFVTLKEILFHQTGTIESSVDGQGDIEQVSLWRDNGNTIFEPAVDTLIGSVLHAGSTQFVNGLANIKINGSSGTIINQTQTNFFVTVSVGETSLGGKSTKGHQFGLKLIGFGDFTFVPATAGADPSIDYASLTSNETFILDEGATIVAPVSLIPLIWADPFGDGYPSIDESGLPKPREFDSSGVPLVDFNGDGANDVVADAATGLMGVDLDGDGLIEVDMTRNGLLDVDFNNDGKPDDVIPDLNGDGVPEIDLSKDGFPEFGYIPEKWSKETSRLFTRWAPIKSSLLKEYQIGLGVNNMSNNVTDTQVPQGWFSSGKENKYELSNLTLLAARVTKLDQSVPIDRNPPFDLLVKDGDGFLAENGQINVGSEIMGYSVRVGNLFAINKRGEKYGTPRQEHLLNANVTNEGYVVRARAVTTGNVFGAESAIKVYRVDVSPPIIPGAPVSDQELAGGQPSKTGVFSIKWPASGDSESGVRAYEIQQREDNDPIWKTIRMVPATQLSFLVGNNDNPSNLPREPGHFYTYRVRAINQAGAASDWSPSSQAASTGFPTESISEVTNYPNPVDTRKEPTNIAYILNEDSTVKIKLFDLLGYEVREWEFAPGANGGRVGPNIFKWDGTDSGGSKVAAGGYIMRIEVVGSKGSTVVIRKIGIVN